MADSDHGGGGSYLGEASMSLSDVSMGEASMMISSDDESYGYDSSGRGSHFTLSPGGSESLKRPPPGAESDEDRHPLKRRPGIYKHAYVHALNSIVSEAAARHIAPGPEEAPLEDSQFGLTAWTADEKQHFFSLVARLGRDNLPAIARELGTKDEFEIRQYIVMLDDAVNCRRNLSKNEDRDKVKEPNILRPVHITDIPAAAEISEEGNRLLESAADALAVRQEKVEDRAEKQKWGGRWRVTQSLAKDLSQLAAQRMVSVKHKGGEMEDSVLGQDEEYANKSSTVAQRDEKIADIVDLFNLPTWLRLSERVFMNGGMDSDDNWRLAGTEKPSMRTTALEDFHTLAKSITKKLVVTSLSIAEQRIRLRMNAVKDVKPRVCRRDVRAAIASTGMRRNPQKFWRDASRRLKLDVYAIEPKAGDVMEPMEYEDIEEALAVDEDSDEEPDIHFDNEYDESDDESNDEVADHKDVGVYGFETTGFPIEKQAISGEEQDSDVADDYDSNDGIIGMMKKEGEEELEIRKDMKEIITYSAVDYPETTQALEALRKRIIAEREREVKADALDMRNSREEELRLWRLLKQQPPEELTRESEAIEDGEKEVKTTVMVDDFFTSMSDWRDTTQYESEWEGEIPRSLGIKK